MKQLLGLYIFVSFVVTGYSIFTTSERDSFGKDHFTEGLMWPVGLFNYVFEPEIDGGSYDSLVESLSELLESRDTDHDRYLGAIAANQVLLHAYVESDPNLTKPEVKKLVDLSRIDKFASLITVKEQVKQSVAERLDGLDFDGLILAGQNAFSKTMKISESRPLYATAEDCVDGLIRAYREELGPDSLIRYDQLQEFNEKCGLPREEW